MDDVTNSPLPNNREVIDEISRQISENIKKNPLEYALLPPGLREYLEDHPDSYSISDKGKIVVDQKDIPPELLTNADDYPMLIVTNFDIPSSNLDRPFGFGHIIDAINNEKPITGDVIPAKPSNENPFDDIIDAINNEKPITGDVTPVKPSNENPFNIDDIQNKPSTSDGVKDVKPSKPFNMI